MFGDEALTSLFTPTVPHRRGRGFPWWAWVVSAVAIFVSAVGGIAFAPEGSPVAIWWPAAGVSVLVGLLASPRSALPAILLVLGVTVLANAVGGRSLLVAAAFGLANAAEVAVVLWACGAFRRRMRLQGLSDAIRFAGAAGAGAATAGLLAAITVTLLGIGDFGRTITFVTASHAAAVLMIAPLGILPHRLPRRRTPIEISSQTLILAVIIGTVFAPGATLPLAFLPYPVLAWAAFRFSLRIVVVQQLVASIAILLLTLAGGGPFSAPGIDPLTGAALAEAFLVTFAGFAVVLASAQHQLRETSRGLTVSTRLLSGGIIDAQVGLATARPAAGGYAVLWRNTAARDLLAAELDDSGFWAGAVADSAADALGSGRPVTVEVKDRVLTVAANPMNDDSQTFAVQIMDVTSIVRAQQALLDAERARADALAEQADLDRQRDDFVSTTSHELRTPVTSILGYLELVRGAPVIGDRERDWLTVVDRNAKRLLGIIEDLLTFGEARESVMDPVPTVDLADIVRDVLATLAPLIDRKNLNVDVRVPSTTVPCNADDARRAVANLLGNAANFTPDGGRITVSAERRGSTTLLRIEDSGPGMDDHALAHAFDRFFRAPEAARMSAPGTGLGLAIARELLRRNQAAVDLERASDRGLRATITFAAGHSPTHIKAPS